MIISGTYLFKCSQSLQCFLAFLVYPFFFLLLLFFYLVSLLYLNKHICKFLKIKVREKGAVTQHCLLPPTTRVCSSDCRTGLYSLPRLRLTAAGPGQWGFSVHTKLSQGAILCKSRTSFFNHSPSEYCDADENILYLLQPVAVGADDFLCIDPGGIIQITYVVFNIMGYSIKGWKKKALYLGCHVRHSWTGVSGVAQWYCLTLPLSCDEGRWALAGISCSRPEGP